MDILFLGVLLLIAIASIISGIWGSDPDWPVGLGFSVAVGIVYAFYRAWEKI